MPLLERRALRDGTLLRFTFRDRPSSDKRLSWAWARLDLDLDGRGGGIYLVAERTGTVVGHAFLESLSLAATSHVARLTIAVHEGHQRRGVGRALLHELLRWARSNPRVEKVELQVRSSNDGAVALYRSFGFVEEGRKTRRLRIGPNEYLDDV